jgi:hypothetical protein
VVITAVADRSLLGAQVYPSKADIGFGEQNVCFGSLADIKEPQSHVRFTPESRHSSAPVACPPSAKSGPAPSALVPHTVGGTIAVAAVCNGRMGCEPHSARAGILQQTGNLLAAKPDCFQRCVKFAPQMKKNRAIAAPACAPLGMDAFTRAQYEWGCGLPRRSHSPRR